MKNMKNLTCLPSLLRLTNTLIFFVFDIIFYFIYLFLSGFLFHFNSNIFSASLYRRFEIRFSNGGEIVLNFRIAQRWGLFMHLEREGIFLEGVAW